MVMQPATNHITLVLGATSGATVTAWLSDTRPQGHRTRTHPPYLSPIGEIGHRLRYLRPGARSGHAMSVKGLNEIVPTFRARDTQTAPYRLATRSPLHQR